MVLQGNKHSRFNHQVYQLYEVCVTYLCDNTQLYINSEMQNVF